MDKRNQPRKHDDVFGLTEPPGKSNDDLEREQYRGRSGAVGTQETDARRTLEYRPTPRSCAALALGVPSGTPFHLVRTDRDCRCVRGCPLHTNDGKPMEENTKASTLQPLGDFRSLIAANSAEAAPFALTQKDREGSWMRKGASQNTHDSVNV